MKKFVVSLVVFAMACTTLGRAVAVADAAKLAICIAQNQDQPLPVVLVRCATENVSPSDIEKILEEQRTATQKAVSAKAHTSSCADAGAEAGVK